MAITRSSQSGSSTKTFQLSPGDDPAVLQMLYFHTKISIFLYILEGLGAENFAIFYGHFVYIFL
jgi:hypothetical protein